MLIEIINKLIYILISMSCLVCLRHLLLFVRHLSNPEPKPYIIAGNDLFYLGLSVSIILTHIFKGLTI